MAKGEKCLTKFSFFGGGSQKYEDAAECFQDAGKMFVLAKSFDEAGKAYLRAAEMFEKTKSDFDTGSVLTRAGEAFQKAQDTRQCSEAYRRAADVFAGAGKGNMAANASKKLAELIEQDDDEDRLPEAVEAYQQATDFYDAENQPRRADGCREKVATISARLGAYDDAITQFDALGRSALQSNLGKFNAKKWFTYSVLCCLAREDLVKAQKLLGEDLRGNQPCVEECMPSSRRDVVASRRRLDGVQEARHRVDGVSSFPHRRVRFIRLHVGGHARARLAGGVVRGLREPGRGGRGDGGGGI